MSSWLPNMLWPVVSALLAIALAWMALRRRGEVKLPASDCWRIAAEDALKVIVELERDEQPVGVELLAAALAISDPLAEAVVEVLVASGWAEEDTNGALRLTERGRARATHLVRAHRLWEQYLVERQGMSLEAVHAEAHRREHATTAERAADLDAELGHPVRDPHGHVIPNPGGRLPQTGGASLTQAAVGKRLRILDVADHPLPLFSQLLAMGLTPGTEIELASREPRRLWVKINGEPMALALEAAERVRAAPVPALSVPMGELPPGGRGRVVETTGGGTHQRRMLDMGLVPGAQVSVLRTAPLGDPVEYLVKGTAISMRRSDANTVLVEEETGPEDG